MSAILLGRGCKTTLTLAEEERLCAYNSISSSLFKSTVRCIVILLRASAQSEEISRRSEGRMQLRRRTDNFLAKLVNMEKLVNMDDAVLFSMWKYIWLVVCVGLTV